jgi:hypothetical protein
MNCVGTTKGAFKGRLPTPEEARKWRIRYNNINNEGGDGYIPSIVTDNQVEWAEKVLAEDTASASK